MSGIDGVECALAEDPAIIPTPMSMMVAPANLPAMYPRLVSIMFLPCLGGRGYCTSEGKIPDVDEGGLLCGFMVGHEVPSRGETGEV